MPCHASSDQRITTPPSSEQPKQFSSTTTPKPKRQPRTHSHPHPQTPTHSHPPTTSHSLIAHLPPQPHLIPQIHQLPLHPHPPQNLLPHLLPHHPHLPPEIAFLPPNRLPQLPHPPHTQIVIPFLQLNNLPLQQLDAPRRGGGERREVRREIAALADKQAEVRGGEAREAAG